VKKFAVTAANAVCSITRQHTYAMQSAILLWQIRPSVCLSVTRWYCIETNANIVKLFPPLVGLYGHN